MLYLQRGSHILSFSLHTTLYLSDTIHSGEIWLKRIARSRTKNKYNLMNSDNNKLLIEWWRSKTGFPINLSIAARAENILYFSFREIRAKPFKRVLRLFFDTCGNQWLPGYLNARLRHLYFSLPLCGQVRRDSVCGFNGRDVIY